MYEAEGYFEESLAEQILPSKYTRRVAELMRLPGVSERWQQRCRESFAESRQRQSKHKTWRNRRCDFLRKAWRHPDQRKRQPPAKDWELVLDRVSSPKGCETKRIWAWVPPEFGNDQEPYVGGPLPFSARHNLSLADCYLVLALVHDAERRQCQVNPFGDDESAQIFYIIQLSHVANLNAFDELTLDDCLARVEDDLASLNGASKIDGDHGGDKAPKAKVQAVLAIIKSQRKGKGISGKQIIATLKRQGTELAESTLRRHILPELKTHWGVINDRSRGGYLIP